MPEGTVLQCNPIWLAMRHALMPSSTILNLPTCAFTLKPKTLSPETLHPKKTSVSLEASLVPKGAEASKEDGASAESLKDGREQL